MSSINVGAKTVGAQWAYQSNFLTVWHVDTHRDIGIPVHHVFKRDIVAGGLHLTTALHVLLRTDQLLYQVPPPDY